MKDDPIHTLRQGDRFSYESVDVEMLRTLPQLPEWLKQNKRARANMRWTPLSQDNDVPPGHPKRLLYQPENYTGKVEGVYVIPDPDNFAWGEVRYEKEHGYEPIFDHPGDTPNRYYVIYKGAKKKLWKPLPWSHLRMQVWEADMYSWHRHCYMGHDEKTFFHPMLSTDRKVFSPKIDPHWKEEYIATVQAEYILAKAAEENEHNQYAAQWATPERHLGVMALRKYFPSYQPRLDLIADPKSHPACSWIEPYRWYKLYDSRAAMESDPIFQLQHKGR